MKNISFYLIVSTSLLLASCAKVEVNTSGWGGGGFNWGGITINGNTFDSTAMLYIKIPLYRYFIYKDSATSSTDSVCVTESNLVFNFRPATANTPAVFYETYSLILTNFTTNGNQTWFKGYASCDSNYKNGTSFIDSNFIFSNEPGILPSFWSPFTSSGALQFSKVPSLIVEGTTYFNVYKFFATNGLPSSDVNYLATTFYWVKGIGIIKKEIRTYNSIKTSLLVRYG
jgi:hypothetical protein